MVTESNDERKVLSKSTRVNRIYCCQRIQLNANTQIACSDLNWCIKDILAPEVHIILGEKEPFA
jgi:hypothetical protein